MKNKITYDIIGLLSKYRGISVCIRFMSFINNRIKNLKLKLILTAVVGVLLLLIVVFDVSCFIRTATGFPCISCGLSRAWLSALKLDFAAAFSYHPMFWSIPVLYLFVLFDTKLFKNAIINWTVFGLIVAGFLVNYIFVLVIN